MKLFTVAFGLMALSITPAFAADTAKPFELPPLPYAYDALEPVISATTMETHYTKHHQAYVDKLNEEVAKTDSLKGKTIEQIVGNISQYNDTVRNNAGGHWNHSFFWSIMAAKDQRGEMSPELKTAIDKNFKSVDDFKTAFNKAGTGRFGSGWVWLIVNKDGKLEITSTPNQDNPLMDNASVKGTPLLGNDVWEHAYYLDYKNKRADYLTKWWNVVNWTKVSSNYAKAVKKQ